LESTWPGASKCRELLIELAEITRANLAKIGKPRESRHTPRSSVQLPSPTGSDPNTIDTSPKSGPSRNRSRSRQRPGINGSVRVHPYAVSGSPAHSTPSPPSIYVMPIKRPHEESGGRPLTIAGAIASGAPLKSVTTEFVPGRQYNSGVQQQTYNSPSWAHPTPPTFLNEPRPFGNYSRDFTSYGPQDVTIRNGTMNAPIYNNPTSSMSSDWAGLDSQTMLFDPNEPSQFSSMDFIQSFAPMSQIPEAGSMWDGMREVFSAEPRMFGILDDYQEGSMD